MDATEPWRERIWARHSNPKSGWSRVVLLPLLLYAVYRRDARIGLVAIAFTLLNPVLFAAPETDDAWMTRVVLAERWWTEERGEGVLGLEYPNGLNLLNVPLTGYAFLAAYRNRPIRAGLAGLGAMLVKLWYVGELVRRYDTATARA